MKDQGDVGGQACRAQRSEGERFLPDTDGPDLAYEHVHRYAIAARMVGGLRVLDLACGSGYGTRLLQQASGQPVVALDLEPGLLRGNAGLGVCGSAGDLPFADESFDAVVFFEAIEHIAEPGAALDEIVRVLRPSGLLLVSTPDRDIYTHRAGHANEHHVSELSREEFEEILRARFDHVELRGQSVVAGSWVGPAAPRPAEGDRRVEVLGDPMAGSDHRRPAPTSSGPDAPLPEPVYMLGACATDETGARRIRDRLAGDSWLHDPGQWLIGQYGRLVESLEAQREELAEAERSADRQSHEADEARRAFTRLEDELAEARRVADRQEAELVAARQISKRHEAELVTARQLADAQAKEIDEARRVEEEQRRQIDGARVAIGELEHEIETARRSAGAFEAEISEARSSIDAFSEQLRRATTSAAQLEEELEEARRRSGEQARQIAAARTGSDSLERQLREAKALTKDQAEQLEAARGGGNDLERQLREAKLLAEDQTEQLEAARGVSNDLARQLREAKTLVEDQAAQLGAARLSSEDQARQLERARRASEEHERQIERAKAAQHDYERQLSEARAIVQALSDDLSKSKAARDELALELQRPLLRTARRVLAAFDRLLSRR
ncbi:MAG: methyltransferase domain-containing protein [Deltaproteobacteria bacterium]|nr:methyltransferase domain-containing protein [Deltaproteobacteria bacterium]MBW2495880.1 methyltransferase domain-containing protein [Deltaproteobacteria bacterium]